jgi:RNA polymerase-binding transcription factor DksA
MKTNNKQVVTFPQKLVEPVKKFLEEELKKLSRTQKSLRKADPFKDETRTGNNSLEEDVDEQVGHFDTEVKVNFLTRQMVQFKKALTRIKLGKFGICEKCGKMIDTDRLAIRPEATICIKCEEDSN